MLILCALTSMAAAPTLTTDELATLAEREVVVQDLDGQTIGVVDCKASPEKVLDAVLDLPPRADEVGPLTTVEVYSTGDERIGARFDVNVLGSTTTLYVLYTIDRPGLRTDFTLDPTKESDVATDTGSYEVIAMSDGHSRLVYRTEVAPGGYIPAWIRQKAQQGPMVEMLEGIRGRAEK